jgi:hypothetical protein
MRFGALTLLLLSGCTFDATGSPSKVGDGSIHLLDAAGDLLDAVRDRRGSEPADLPRDTLPSPAPEQQAHPDFVCSAPCAFGQVETQQCGKCGTRERACSVYCQWGPWGSCLGQGTCSAGEVEDQTCGNCNTGKRSRSCGASCAWSGWSACSGGGVCYPGEIDSQSCGSGGVQERQCKSDCSWGSWGSCVGGCTDGEPKCNCRDRWHCRMCQSGVWTSCWSCSPPCPP